MFGLFKKQPKFNSPQDKLKYDMKRKIEGMALLQFDDSPLKGGPMEGMALIEAINQAEQFYFQKSIAVSEDYGVSRDDTVAIIKQTARSVYSEFIDQ
jgi:hypothetical protein